MAVATFFAFLIIFCIRPKPSKHALFTSNRAIKALKQAYLGMTNLCCAAKSQQNTGNSGQWQRF